MLNCTLKFLVVPTARRCPGRLRTKEAAMGEFSPWHLLIVAGVLVLLFGSAKLPQMARSLGQSMRIFKAETRALSGEKEPEQLPRAASAPPQSSPATQSSATPAQSSATAQARPQDRPTTT